MISPYIITILVVLLIIIVLLIVWIAYCLIPSYQQTITVKSAFENTNRYIPHFNDSQLYELDNIKVVVTGSVKKNNKIISSIIPSLTIEKIINEYIIDEYRNCLLLHESDSFNINDSLLVEGIKRYPIDKYHTNENLSIIFFNKLSPIFLNNGCQLVQLTLVANGAKVSHYRHKHRF